MATLKVVEYLVICDECSDVPGTAPHRDTPEDAQGYAREHGWVSPPMAHRRRVPMKVQWYCPPCWDRIEEES